MKIELTDKDLEDLKMISAELEEIIEKMPSYASEGNTLHCTAAKLEALIDKFRKKDENRAD